MNKTASELKSIASLIAKKATGVFAKDHADTLEKFNETYLKLWTQRSTDTEEERLKKMRDAFKKAIRAYDRGNGDAVFDAIDTCDELENYAEGYLKASKDGNYGIPTGSGFVKALGEVIPHLEDSNGYIDTFWKENHAEWNNVVKAYLKRNKIILVSDKMSSQPVEIVISSQAMF